MVHDVVFKIPVVRNLLIRMGALRASRANASKVLDLGGVVVAYPGGTLEALRSFRNRNRIDFGGHTGFIEVALQHGVPILPVANVGAHEVYLTLFSSQLLARLTGMERLTGVKTLPVNLGLPWGIWPTGFLPYLPLPSKIVFKVGKPVQLPRNPKLAGNRLFVRNVLNEVSATMQHMVDELASRRRYPILG
jgi:1-acyl-sn-glycerol-3-phosphate acyltransferase